MTAIEEVFLAFSERGADLYVGEAVTQQEHALQAAWAAEQAGAPSALIAAALLHDIGHLLHDLPEDCADDGIDDRHEGLGANWLAEHFVPAVVEPVRLHVAAKRYLCVAEPGYGERLSAASVRSLELQGGPFTALQAERFIAAPHAREAVALRQWDEQAKVPGLSTPALEHFRPHLERSLLA